MSKVAFGDRCVRCERRAVELIYCQTHYNQWLSEWACDSCGNINGGILNRAREICPTCKARRA